MDSKGFDLIFFHEARDFVFPRRVAEQAAAWIARHRGSVDKVPDPDKGRFSLLRRSDEEWELLARVSVEEDTYSFILEVCFLARELDCDLYAPELGRAMAPVPSSVVGCLMQSEAWSSSWGAFDSTGEAVALSGRCQ